MGGEHTALFDHDFAIKPDGGMLEKRPAMASSWILVTVLASNLSSS